MRVFQYEVLTVNDAELLATIIELCHNNLSDQALGQQVKELIQQREREQEELSSFLSDCGDACKL
ncbi:hypothetical protein WH50_18890 [Pokkaliibacter plantistimulans]|uniref:Uncharacterized protein n=1 Tax=Pokkaliibacter plantistimulans TaxID=1635171 RepID=A0ABX5LUI0_9GAMM|nr:hypothetical protein WH50_18890 [Pokkaliibacter plantistimulans]